MSNEQIIEGNILIADFMGMERTAKETGEVTFKQEKNSVIWASQLSYHVSWDWLIPSYNSILSLINSDKELIKKVRQNALILHAVRSVLDGSGVTIQIEISSSWLKIVDFIKWYNQNK